MGQELYTIISLTGLDSVRVRLMAENNTGIDLGRHVQFPVGDMYNVVGGGIDYASRTILGSLWGMHKLSLRDRERMKEDEKNKMTSKI